MRIPKEPIATVAAGLTGSAIMVLASVGTTGLATMAGCHSTSNAASPRAEDAILAVAQGVAMADTACAATGQSLNAAGKKDDAVLLLKACAQGVSVARSSLLLAESMATTSTASELACVALPALNSLESLVASVTAGGGVVSKSLAEALTVGSALSKLATCRDAGVMVLLDAGHD